MKVAVAGGTGFVGAALTNALVRRGHGVTVLARRPRPASRDFSVVVWNPSNPAGLELVLSGFDAVVNLAGESVANGRWTEKRRRELVESRLESTRTLIEGMSKCSRKPSVLVNASAVGYYGARGGEELTEEALPGSGFLADLCVQWEEQARRAEALGVRVVLLRIGIVLGKGGGALAKMLPPFKLGVGGPLGSGRQGMSWIHIDDLTGLILQALESRAWQGVFNATAPEPVTNQEFSKTLGRVLRRPAFFRAPAPVLRLALGPMADEMLLSGQRVIPRKALQQGYSFQHPRLEEALRSLVN
jgi:uncharacterized protein